MIRIGNLVERFIYVDDNIFVPKLGKSFRKETQISRVNCKKHFEWEEKLENSEFFFLWIVIIQGSSFIIKYFSIPS